MSTHPLQEQNYQKVIPSYSLNDWQPLFDLIYEIEALQKFGEVSESKEVEKRAFTFPNIEESPVVSKFIDIVYGIPIIINFDREEWEEGKEMINNENLDYYSIDLPTKCKIISTIVRADSFIEGTLASAFNRGIILKLLYAMEWEVKSKNRHQHKTDDFSTAMHVEMLMDIEGEEDVIYDLYLDLSGKMGEARALKEMGLKEPPVKPEK